MINKEQLIGLLKDLEFPNAADWDNEKLAKRAAQIPDKVSESDVSEKFKAVYKQLVDDGGKVDLGDGKVVASTGAIKSTVDVSKMDKARLSELLKEYKLPVIFRKDDTIEKCRKIVQNALDKKAAKPTKEDKEKKAAAPAKPKVLRDEFGCKEGSISSKVNKVLTTEWQEEVDLAKIAGVTLDQARGRLYYAADEGEIERRKLIQYRRLPKGAKAPPKPVLKK